MKNRSGKKDDPSMFFKCNESEISIIKPLMLEELNSKKRKNMKVSKSYKTIHENLNDGEFS